MKNILKFLNPSISIQPFSLHDACVIGKSFMVIYLNGLFGDCNHRMV